MVDELKQGEFYMDPNGVPMPKRSLHEHQYTVDQLREMKQKYLMENVINCGYDPTEFAQFMEYKMCKCLSFSYCSKLLSSSSCTAPRRERQLAFDNLLREL